MDIQKRLAATVDELRTAISERDRRIEALEDLLVAVRDDAMRADNDLCGMEARADKAEAQLTASRAECEGLRAAVEEYYARGFGLRRRIVDYLNSQASKNAIRNAFTEWECASGTKFLLSPAEVERAALSQKETGDADR